jgi:hypothetical protein
MHQRDGSDDNGYDINGKQINNNGGDTTDYRYDDNGNIIDSTPVQFRAVSQGEFRELGGFRGYGVKGFAMNTGAISEDNTIANLFTGGAVVKGVGSILSSKSASLVLKYSNTLNKGNWWRLGMGKHNGQVFMRAAWGAHKNYLDQVPKHLQGLNKMIRKINGGHKDFPNWKQ